MAFDKEALLYESSEVSACFFANRIVRRVKINNYAGGELISQNDDLTPGSTPRFIHEGCYKCGVEMVKCIAQFLASLDGFPLHCNKK